MMALSCFPSAATVILFCILSCIIIFLSILYILYSLGSNKQLLRAVLQVPSAAGQGGTKWFFLAIVAFDHYLAICQPLHFAIIMTGQLCMNLVVTCWVSGFLWFLAPVILISQQSFCGSRVIDHFLCDPDPRLALTCTRAPLVEFTCSFVNSLPLFIPFLFIMGAYAMVLRAVLRVPSAAGRRKAFSTCGSHLTVVSLFYGSVMVMYVKPTSGHEAGAQKIVTLFYSVVTPFLNPLIYSLRNKDMKDALRKILSK